MSSLSSLKKFRIEIFFFSFLLGCVQSPTKITESLCCRIKSSTLVVDARSSFHYKLFRLAGSIHIRGEDFFEKNKKGERTSRLKVDLHREIQRLALLGVNPNSEILIVGEGKRGQGEEGRLTWIFLYLGLKNVQFSSIDSFNRKGDFVAETFDRSSTQKNQPLWEPKFLKKLLFSVPVPLERFLLLKKFFKQTEFQWFLDVSEKKKFDKAMQLDWREFLDDRGRPNLSLKKKLLSKGFRFKDRILVLSEKGFKSMTVVAALFLMGFENASHFEGGYESFAF